MEEKCEKSTYPDEEAGDLQNFEICDYTTTKTCPTSYDLETKNNRNPTLVNDAAKVECIVRNRECVEHMTYF